MRLFKRMPQLLITDRKVKWPLHFAFSYTQPVPQHYKQRTVREASLQKINPVTMKIRMIQV